MNVKGIAFWKPNDSIRPIGVMCALDKVREAYTHRKLKAAKGRLSNQFGYNTPHGCSRAGALLQATVELDDTAAVIIWDVKNAFNSVERSNVLETIQADPATRHLAPMFLATYNCITEDKVHLQPGPDTQLSSEELKVTAQRGVVQGGSTSTDYFNIALQPALCKMNSDAGCYTETETIAVHDDMATTITANEAAGDLHERLRAIVEATTQHLADLGLEINQEKLLIWDPHGIFDNTDDNVFRLNTVKEAKFAGWPLELHAENNPHGVTVTQLKEVSDDLAHRVSAIQELLRVRDGRDLAMRLIRVGAASMVTHLLRQTPYNLTAQFAEDTHATLMNAIARIMDVDISQITDDNELLITLSTSLGGLGVGDLRKIRHAAKLGMMADLHNANTVYSPSQHATMNQWLAAQDQHQTQPALDAANYLLEQAQHARIERQDLLSMKSKAQKQISLKLLKAKVSSFINECPTNATIVQKVHQIRDNNLPNGKTKTQLSKEINQDNRKMDTTATLLCNQQIGSADILNIHVAGEEGLPNKEFARVLQSRTNTITWDDDHDSPPCPACRPSKTDGRTVCTFAHAAGCPSVTAGTSSCRHNTIVKALAGQLGRSGYSVAIEPPNDGTLQGQQRVDLTFNRVEDMILTAADVTTVITKSDQRKTIINGKLNAPLEQADKDKRKKYEHQLQANGINFTPLSTSYNGGISAPFLLLIKQASRRRAKRHHPDEGYSATYFANITRRRIAVAIAMSTGISTSTVLDLIQDPGRAWHTSDVPLVLH